MIVSELCRDIPAYWDRHCGRCGTELTELMGQCHCGRIRPPAMRPKVGPVRQEIARLSLIAEGLEMLRQALEEGDGVDAALLRVDVLIQQEKLRDMKTKLGLGGNGGPAL